MKAYKQLENRIAWMRANVRCETCKHWLEPTDPSGRRKCMEVYSDRFLMYMTPEDSCATHWEPEEASDGR